MSDSKILSPSFSPTIPALLRDYAGRELEVQTTLDTTQIVTGIGPIGCFVFVKSDEVKMGRPVYTQHAEPAVEALNVEPPAQLLA